MTGKGIVLLLSLWSIAGLNKAQEATSNEKPILAFCYEDARCNEAGNNTWWPTLCKTGQHQSPVNLPEALLANAGLKSLKFTGYKSDSFYITNNGHTIQVQFESTATSTSEISGWELDNNGPYIFGQMHIHWGKDGLQGSEHTINNKRFDLEIHFVHYAKKWGNISAAAASNDPQALAVYGVLLNVEKQSIVQKIGQLLGWTNSADKALAPIIANFPQNMTNGAVFVNERIDLTPLLGKTGDKFYRYFGSLTTPGCAEVVLWTVNRNILTISETDDGKFRDVNGEEGEEVPANHRDTKPLNGRKVKVAIEV